MSMQNKMRVDAGEPDGEIALFVQGGEGALTTQASTSTDRHLDVEDYLRIEGRHIEGDSNDRISEFQV
jgi:hypothetical protein